MKNIVIFGATSAIAQAVIKRFAEGEQYLYLIGRDEERLDLISNDLLARGVGQVDTLMIDINCFSEEHFNKIIHSMTQIDLLFIAHGSLPDQNECQRNLPLMQKEVQTNALSTINILTLFANHFEEQKSGTIATITSVSGDRGRQSNYAYGASKAMVSTYLQGLAQRLSKFGINVIDIKPGLIDTPMTKAFDKSGFLWSSPQKVAQDIESAINKRKQVVYTPFFWRYIMFIIKLIPNRIFNKIRL